MRAALVLTFALADAFISVDFRARRTPALNVASDVPGTFTDWQLWSELLVLRNRPSDKDFVFCAIAKNGCSVWKQAFLRALGVDHWNTTDTKLVHNPVTSGLDLVGYNADHTRNLSDIQALMGPASTTFKAAIVRDPITRFLSAYLDRCIDNNEWGRCRTEGYASLEDVISAYEARGDHEIDMHFVNQSHVCGLQYTDYVHFDVISKYEDFVNASQTILKTANLWEKVGASGWGVNGAAAFGEEEQVMNNHLSEHHTDDLVCQYYTKSSLERVIALYKPDFERFGYSGEKWFLRCASKWEKDSDKLALNSGA